MPERPFSVISTPETLQDILPALAAADSLAVDTEADSLFRYQERVCLLQISTREADYIVDPLALRELSPLIEVLQGRELLFHGSDYDLSGLFRDFGLRASSIFDTQIASWLLGYGQPSLASLCETRLGVVLEKAHQKDDWGQRPLPLSMLEYAREDTRYLHSLVDQLQGELRDKGWQDAAEEEFARLASKDFTRRPFDPEGWFWLKGAQDLSPDGYPALRALYLWRDQQAKMRNVPHFKIVQNSDMLTLAERRPKTWKDLQGLRLPPALVNRQGQDWLRIIANAPPAQAPALPSKRPAPSAEERERLSRLKTWRDETAKRLDLDPTLVATSGFLENVLKQCPQSREELAALPDARAWRLRRFGDSLLAVVQGWKRPSA
jgi:ribonuclease D